MLGALPPEMVLMAGLGVGVVLSWLTGAFSSRFAAGRRCGVSGRQIPERLEPGERPSS